MKNKILVLAIILGLTACNNDKAEPEVDPKDMTTSENDNSKSTDKSDIKVNIKNKKSSKSSSNDIENKKDKEKESQINKTIEDEDKVNEDQKSDNNPPGNTEESEFPKEVDEGMKEFVFNNLRGEELYNTLEDSPQIYSRIDCADDGHFFGYYFGTKAADHYDAGLQEAARKAGREEAHESEFEGDFEVLRQLEAGVFELKVKNLHITSTPGVDSEMPFKAKVDFQKLVDESHTYILYTHGAYLPLSERRGTDLEERFTPNFEPLKSESQVKEDHAYGPILYDKTADLAWNAWVY